LKNYEPGLEKRSIRVPRGELRPPLFMPDATFGFVRSLDAVDLKRCGIQAVVMNVFHLMQSPGSSVIQGLGGLHGFSGWDRPIITDSGGFQAYSLIRQNSGSGNITKRGILFRPKNFNRKLLLTPEKSIQLQLRYGSDLLICLDDCTHVDDPRETQMESVDRTIHWAERCKSEFTKLIRQRGTHDAVRPLLFAVVQGGGSYDLRRNSAEALLEMGFNGYAYGGYPLDNEGNLLASMMRYTRELIPREFPMIALGVGEPRNIVKCIEMGYELFDSSLPTRDARQGRLYVFKSDLYHERAWEEKGIGYLYIRDMKHIKDKGPVSPHCDCLTCSEHSLAFLHHLYEMKDPLYFRLATIHNLRFMTLLVEHMKGPSDEC